MKKIAALSATALAALALTAAPASALTAQTINTSTMPTSGTTFGADVQLHATASSGLPVAWDSASSAICTVSPTGVVDFKKRGTCRVAASQAGNATYAPVQKIHNIVVFF